MVDGNPPSFDPGKLLKAARAALREEFLRQHYLDQVLGSASLPRSPSQPRRAAHSKLLRAAIGWLPGNDGKLGPTFRAVKERVGEPIPSSNFQDQIPGNNKP